MAKRSNEPIFGGDKAKVRVFFAELEGNNDSVQEALKTMVSAMSRPVRIISEPRINGTAPVLLDKADIEEVEESFEHPVDAETLGGDEPPQNGRKPRGTGKKTDRNAGLELVPDLNFRPNDKPTLKEFIAKKNPGSDVEAVTLFVYYMQHMMSLNNISPSHIMTAFREAGKAIPVDLKQTVRNIKKSKMWLNFTDIEEIRTTTQGDNFVEHEMGASE